MKFVKTKCNFSRHVGKKFQNFKEYHTKNENFLSDTYTSIIRLKKICIYICIYICTYKYIYVYISITETRVKLADDEGDAIENALNTVVITLEKSVKMKKELKLTILDAVSTLRNLCVKLKTNSETKTSKIRELEAVVTKVKTDLHMAAGKTEKECGAPSVIQGRLPEGLGVHGEPSVVQGQNITGQTVLGALRGIHRKGTPQQREREESPAVVTERWLYSEALTIRITPNRFKLKVKPKETLPPESNKGLLKAKINTSKIRVGINALRTLRNGQVLI